MRWVIIAIIFTALTVFAFLASAAGWGLPGMLEKPVSVRQESAGSGGYRRSSLIYFGSGRRHFGGGFAGGK